MKNKQDIIKNASFFSLRRYIEGSGWYRIAELDKTASNGTIDIRIMTDYFNNNNSVHHVELLCPHSKSKFKLISGYANVLTISKIRHVYDSIEKKTYIDIYYNVDTGNNVYAFLCAYGNVFSPIILEPTEEAVDGCTVVSSAELTANY